VTIYQHLFHVWSNKNKKKASKIQPRVVILETNDFVWPRARENFHFQGWQGANEKGKKLKNVRVMT
jgi:hypothetical protein